MRTGTFPTLPLLFAAAALLLVLLPGITGSYGPFIDELYYVSCAERPAWGYVDHPPGAPIVLRATRMLLGDGLLALRLPAALLTAVLVFGAGALARRLGAGTWGQSIACLAVILAPIYQIFGGTYSMNPFEVLAWFALAWIALEIERRGDERRWLWFGAVAGIGLLFKHTVILYPGALFAVMLFTPARRHLRSKHLWLGAGIGIVFLAPNLVWQMQHDWPSLEFYRNADLYKNVPTPPHIGLLLQMLVLNPGSLPVLVAGFAYFLRRRDGFDARHLGGAALLLLLAMLLSGKSRPDRIAGMYPLLLVGGAVLWEQWTAVRRRWLRAAVPSLMALVGVVLLPLGIPLLPPSALAAYGGRLGIVPQIEAGAGKKAQLPQWLADRLGWEQLVDDVVRARDRLAPEEREKAIYFAPSYGQAGALDWLGRDRGLAPVYCAHNTWYLWGPPPGPVEVAIVIGNNAENLGRMFEEVEEALVHDCDYCMPWRDDTSIWIVRRAKIDIAKHWKDWKHFE